MMTITGMSKPGKIVIDARRGPVTLCHERASVPAVNRFNLPEGEDVVISTGYRVVIDYDRALCRYRILQVVPIPEDE